jgi:amidohydrolase
MIDGRALIRDAVADNADTLVALSHRIHANPELGFAEHRAVGWIGTELARAGFDVTTGLGDLDTALSARFGSGPLVVALCAEYDALPEIGHACGHNIIAAAAVGAALALARVADDIGITVHLVGTPGEENGGGKIALLAAGVFDDAGMAMMVHPAPFEAAEPYFIAASGMSVDYAGQEAHAALAPFAGINAADALVVAQVALGLLRQQTRPTDYIHGITTSAGSASNVIPAHASAEYGIRARTVEDLDHLRARVIACFEAGALATGATLTLTTTANAYAELHHDRELAAIYQRNAQQLGRTFDDPVSTAIRLVGSTDMGNVSRAVASIHPLLDIDCGAAVNHQREFADFCRGPAADAAIIAGATAMAWTALDVATDPASRHRLLDELAGRHAPQPMVGTS